MANSADRKKCDDGDKTPFVNSSVRATGSSILTNPRWAATLSNLGNAALTGDNEQIERTWGVHHASLSGVRGIFAVDDKKYEKPSLPGDIQFGEAGKLCSLIEGRRLFLIQNHDNGRNFSYGPHVFCDTNFVSFCRSFQNGRNLGSNERAFREAVAQVLPFSHALDASPYMFENAERSEQPEVRETLRAFLAFKYTPFPAFARHGRFDPAGDFSDLDEAVDDELKRMRGADFALLRRWMEDHHRWANVTLMKAALLTFKKQGQSVESRLYEFLSFLHRELGRIPNFPVYLAHRYFASADQERFFNPLKLGAKKLEHRLSGMAWDLAHWKSLYETLLMRSRREEWTSFPIPYLLSFDRGFSALTETFRPRAVLYSNDPLRCEHIYGLDVLKPVSDLLWGRCGEFFTDRAKQEREHRQTSDENSLDHRLIELESELKNQLASATGA